jgi:hypothetical protein
MGSNRVWTPTANLIITGRWNGKYAEKLGVTGVGAEGVEAPVALRGEADLAEAIILLRDHPQWAIWLPASSGDWIAIRPASSRPPSPELPTIWVHADTASELANLMQAADEQVSGRSDLHYESS